MFVSSVDPVVPFFILPSRSFGFPGVMFAVGGARAMISATRLDGASVGPKRPATILVIVFLWSSSSPCGSWGASAVSGVRTYGSALLFVSGSSRLIFYGSGYVGSSAVWRRWVFLWV